jgi:large conductance mechanosensitive channel
MGLLKEFKEFAVKGNAIDLAVGVIIGGAFGKIVDSIVNDLFMPLVSGIIGKPDFSNLYVVLKGVVADGTPLVEAKKVAGTVVFAYGSFITVFINFLLLAFIIFLFIKGINKLKATEAKTPPAPPAPSAQETLLTEIRDLLKQK